MFSVSGTLIYFDFFVSGLLFDHVAQRSEGVKRGKLYASSVAFLQYMSMYRDFECEFLTSFHLSKFDMREEINPVQ
jgi:hypothetical protein